MPRTAERTTNPNIEHFNEGELTPIFETSGPNVFQQKISDRKSKEKRLDEINRLKNNPDLSRSDLPKAHDRYKYSTYKYDFYCGAQAKVFFGDIWVDDIVTIQYLSLIHI